MRKQSSVQVLFSGDREQDLLRPFKYFAELFGVYLARKNTQLGYPQLAIWSFDYIGLTVNLEGRYESHALNILKNFLREKIPNCEKKVALDVGANIGNHSVFFADFFSFVYAYEPNPVTFALLEVNAKYAATKNNIEARNYGLSDETGKLQLTSPSGNLGGARLSECTQLDSQKNPNIVELRKADDLAELSNKDIALIKVDVEGHELRALRGAEGLLRKNSPIVLFEMHANEIDCGTSPVVEYLKGLNYEFATISKNFDFGSFALLRLLSLSCRIIFGKQFKIVSTEKFEDRFYELVIAIPKNLECD